MKISFQGVLGAYSHQAIVENYPDAEVIPCRSFEGAFEAVQTGAADLAMIPIENSTYGRITDVHHLLPKSGLHIIEEYFLPIRINWLVRDEQRRENIKRAISHTVLLGQCRDFLIKNEIEWENFGDTALAARYVSESNDPELSALSSPFAGAYYGLKALAENIQDYDHNTTRFLALSKEPSWAEPKDRVMTSFVFDVRNIPAALYKALGGFATNNINMTKLESYMIDGRFSATQFYAEVDGHPEDVGMKHAFEELEFFTSQIKILGVFKASPYRQEKSQE